MALPQVVLQEIKKSFEGVHWGAKTYWISPASIWNSTTITTLMNMVTGRASFRTSIPGERGYISVDGCLAPFAQNCYDSHDKLGCLECACTSCFLREIYQILPKFYLNSLILSTMHPTLLQPCYVKSTGAHAPVKLVLTERGQWPYLWV